MDDPTSSRLRASFRDPAGFVFRRAGVLYRQVNRCYESDYRRLMSSGLYEELVSQGLLVPHRETDAVPPSGPHGFLVIEPCEVPFVSYPYEWCFGQLHSAALLTLSLQEAALRRGMTLKDASPFNIQFNGCSPVLIDTLSFETLTEDSPWRAYRQFCEGFLAPLALMAHCDVRLGRLLGLHLDGIPLDLARSILPAKSLTNLHRFIHLYVHARSQALGPKYLARSGGYNLRRHLALVDSLRSAVQSLAWKPSHSRWVTYYDNAPCSKDAESKRDIVAKMFQRVAPRLVWDLGANTGLFSRLGCDLGAMTVAFDSDPACVETMFRRSVKANNRHLLPLMCDVTNPTPALGWQNAERSSMIERGPADLVLALALVHHLAIGSNVRFDDIARFLAEIGEHLLVEFVPKDDPMVQRLLMTRRDTFVDYTQGSFERAFEGYFRISQCIAITGSTRVLYHMINRRSTLAVRGGVEADWPGSHSLAR